jgi:hypothetical protein
MLNSLYIREALPKASMFTPISDNNKGAKMLQQMGWKKGEGLGKDGSGILNPIRAESYAQSAGIGASSKRDMTDGSYRDRTLNLVSSFDNIFYFTCLFIHTHTKKKARKRFGGA